MEMDVAAVQAALRDARAGIDGLPTTGWEASVQRGSQLLRHEQASPAMNTAAERLQELLDELRALTVDVIDVVDLASCDLAGTDADIGKGLDAIRTP